MPKGFRNLKQKLARASEDISRNTDRKTRTSLREMRADARSNVAGNDAIYLGTVINSFRIVGGQGHYRLTNYAPHAAFLEYGTGSKNIGTRMDERFNAPPLTGRLINEIKAWMILKPVIPRTGSLNNSAYLIARSLSRWGQSPQPFMRPAYLRQEHIYINSMKNVVRRAI